MKDNVWSSCTTVSSEVIEVAEGEKIAHPEKLQAAQVFFA